MKKIIFYFIISLLFISSTSALDTNTKIYDYSDLLTEKEEQLLKEKIDTFIENYNLDMVLVTVDKHDNYSTQDYADDFYDYNGFGIGKTHDGLILVIDNNFEKENLQIETTGEAIRIYDDDRIDNILDVIYEDYDYYKLFEDFIDECSYYAELGIPYSNKNTYIDSHGNLVYKKHFPIFISIGISTLISTLVLIFLIHKNKMIKKATEANEYLNRDNINFTERKDQFITTHTTTVRIQTNSGGGGRVGGSSTHIGGSGISHGGGGRSR